MLGSVKTKTVQMKQQQIQENILVTRRCVSTAYRAATSGQLIHYK